MFLLAWLSNCGFACSMVAYGGLQWRLWGLLSLRRSPLVDSLPCCAGLHIIITTLCRLGILKIQFFYDCTVSYGHLF